MDKVKNVPETNLCRDLRSAAKIIFWFYAGQRQKIEDGSPQQLAHRLQGQITKAVNKKTRDSLQEAVDELNLIAKRLSIIAAIQRLVAEEKGHKQEIDADKKRLLCETLFQLAGPPSV